MEGAMSTMSLEVMTVRWSQANPNGQRRGRSRCDLIGLSDRILKDIGMARCVGDLKAATPSWIA
jgi:uncharacterized protein YjiS (DUF1127 family)